MTSTTQDNDDEKNKFLKVADVCFRQMGGGSGTYEGSLFHQKDELPQEARIAFGSIKFDSLKNNMDAYYIRVPKETPPGLLLHFVENVWGLKRPNLLIGITGSADNNLKKSNELASVLDELIDVARHTSAWLISGGTDAGIMKNIGQARYRRGGNTPLIGFASWGVIHGRESMIINKRLINYGYVTREPIQYKCEGKPAKGKVYLDSNHSHFVLVDDGLEKFGAEIDLRGGFESCAISASDTYKEAGWLEEMLASAGAGSECKGWEGSKYKLAHPEGTVEEAEKNSCGGSRAICLCFGGGPGTIGTIYSSVRNETPVLIVQGTGRAADLIADCLRIYENHSQSQAGDEEDDENTSTLKEIIDVHNEWLKMRRVAMISRFLTLMREIKVCKEMEKVGDKTTMPSDKSQSSVWWAPKNFELLECDAGKAWPWRRYVVGPVGQPEVTAAEETGEEKKRAQAYWVNHDYLINHPVQADSTPKSGKAVPPDQAWIEEHKDTEGAILHPGTDLHWKWAAWLGNKLIEEYEIKPPNSECVKMELICQLYESLTSGRCMTYNLWARQEVDGKLVQLDILENMSLCIIRGMVKSAAAKKLKLCWELWKLFHTEMRGEKGKDQQDTMEEDNADIRKAPFCKKCTEIDKEVYFRQVNLLIEWKQPALFQEIMKDHRIRSKEVLNRCLQLALLHDSVEIASQVLHFGATTDAFAVKDKDSEAPCGEAQPGKPTDGNNSNKALKNANVISAVRTASGVVEGVWQELLDTASDEIEERYLRELIDAAVAALKPAHDRKSSRSSFNGDPKALATGTGTPGPTEDQTQVCPSDWKNGMVSEEQAVSVLNGVYTILASNVLDDSHKSLVKSKSLSFCFTRDVKNHWTGDDWNLFLSLLVMNRAELANLFFLRHAECNPSHMLSNSLWACLLTRQLAELHASDTAYHAYLLRNSFENIALRYEDIAGDILKIAYDRSDKSALLALEKHLHQFEKWTCLDLILKGNCEKVIQKCPELCIRAVQNRFMGDRGIQGAMGRMDKGLKDLFPFLADIIADKTGSFSMLGARNAKIVQLLWNMLDRFINNSKYKESLLKFGEYIALIQSILGNAISLVGQILPVDVIISSVFPSAGQDSNSANLDKSNDQHFYLQLFFCIGVDLISCSEYFIPVLPGFVLSYLWPLVTAYLVFCLHGNISLTMFALLEESLPVLNLFPTTTVGLLLKSRKDDSDAEKEEEGVDDEAEFVPFDHYIRDVFTHFIFAYLMTALLLDRSSAISYPLEVLVVFLLLLDKLAAAALAGIKEVTLDPDASFTKILWTGLTVYLDDQGGKLAFASFIIFVTGFIFRYFSYLVCYPLSFLWDVGDLVEASNVLYGMAVGLRWLRLLNFVLAQQDLGQFVRVMQNMAQDLGFFSIVWGILILAFSSAMLGAMAGPKSHDSPQDLGAASSDSTCPNEEEGEDPPMEGWALWWFIRTYLQSLGQDYMDKMKTGASNVIFLVMWPIFNVLLVNLLVAVMGDRYDDAKEKSQISYCVDLDTLDRGFRFGGKTNLLSAVWAAAGYMNSYTETSKQGPVQEPSASPQQSRPGFFRLASLKDMAAGASASFKSSAVGLRKLCTRAFIIQTLEGIKRRLAGDSERKFMDELVDCERSILRLIDPTSGPGVEILSRKYRERFFGNVQAEHPSGQGQDPEYKSLVYKKLKADARAVVERRSRHQYQARKVKDHMVECAQEVLHVLRTQDTTGATATRAGSSDAAVQGLLEMQVAMENLTSMMKNSLRIQALKAAEELSAQTAAQFTSIGPAHKTSPSRA